MALKTLLVPTEQHDLMTSTLMTAVLMARQFCGYMEGFALRPSIDSFAAMDPVSSMAVATVRQHDEEAVRQARGLFAGFMHAQGIAEALPTPHGVPTFGWLNNAPDGDNFVGSYGRVFDLTVLGRPGDDPQSPRMATLEAALFESGRPVLVAPPQTPKQWAQHVLVAWNCSTEQARATAFAMPLLKAATEVTVLTVEGGTVPGPSGAELARTLRLHGIAAGATTLKAGKRQPGELILTQAEAWGCDLIVKGAYTQSRLRQMIFGGATRHILAHAEVPVLMAH